MYTTERGSPASSLGTFNKSSSAALCSPTGSLLSPGASSDAAELRQSLLEGSVHETGDGEDDGVDTGFFGRGARSEDSGRFMTVCSVLNFMIGSGILNTAQTFRNSGLAATTVLYFIACPATWLGVVVLIQAAEALPFGDGGEGGGTTLDDLEYTELTRRTLGNFGALVMDSSVVLLLFGSTWSYIILIGGLATSLVVESTPGAIGAWWQSFYFVTPMILFVLVLPMCLIRHFSNLRWLAPISFLTMVAVVGLVVVGSPLYAEAQRISGTETESDTVDTGNGLDAPLLWWDWTQSLAKIGSVMFALGMAPAALPSYTGMAKRTTKEWRAVAGWTVLTGGLLCYSTGIVGYLSFRAATEGDILDNFSGPVAAGFKTLVVVHLVLYTPSPVVILRHSLFKMVGSDVMAARFTVVSVVTVFVMVVLVGGVLALVSTGMAQGELFGYILDLTGGITTSLIGYIIPALAYLQATKGIVHLNAAEGNGIAAYRAGCKFLAGLGCVLLVMVPSAVVFSIVRS